MFVSKPMTSPWEDVVTAAIQRAQAEHARRPIVHFGNKIWAPALAAKHNVQLPVERLITISTFDLTTNQWRSVVEVKE